ncbi:hypothetical protein [Streptomyces albidoflavus]|uniref:hypothetical protein n=1 Tax=Streptomyces albidoflavus TaxID=1886 RepID=UPI0033A02212
MHHVSYQKALAHVIACSEAGLLPAKLDREGMAKALVILRDAFDSPGARPRGRARQESGGGDVSKDAAVKPLPFSKDPRCIALAEALKPVLRASCPEGAGGFGGSLQANLHPQDAEALGGVPLIRAAMRRAARQLGWRVQTLGREVEALALVLVHDVREAPAEYADALADDRMTRSREASRRISAVLGEADMDEFGPSPVARQTRAFLEAAQAAMAADPAAWRPGGNG